LRTFPTIKGFSYKDVVEKVEKGKGVDKCNAGIQLAELLHLTTTDSENPAIKKAVIENLSQKEKRNFLKQLTSLGDPRANDPEYTK